MKYVLCGTWLYKLKETQSCHIWLIFSRNSHPANLSVYPPLGQLFAIQLIPIRAYRSNSVLGLPTCCCRSAKTTSPWPFCITWVGRRKAMSSHRRFVYCLESVWLVWIREWIIAGCDWLAARPNRFTSTDDTAFTYVWNAFSCFFTLLQSNFISFYGSMTILTVAKSRCVVAADTVAGHCLGLLLVLMCRHCRPPTDRLLTPRGRTLNVHKIQIRNNNNSNSIAIDRIV